MRKCDKEKFAHRWIKILNTGQSKTTQAEVSDLSESVGKAIKRQRKIANFTMRHLANVSGVSAAMVSRIESGQVSPSLATLEALANSLSLSVVTLFAATVKVSDVMFVKAGGGIPATRTMSFHNHSYQVLGSHRKDPMSFEAASITVVREDNHTHPRYINRGFVFLTVTSGECIYDCGPNEFRMNVGDSITFDAELVHGLKEVVTKTVTYSTVSAKII